MQSISATVIAFAALVSPFWITMVAPVVVFEVQKTWVSPRGEGLAAVHVSA